jgi:MerR family transcriptional regulator, thiopeptide resistance regulator
VLSMSARGHTVSQVAKLAHVTVRALHHYDEIGLLVPSDRSRAGYRLYSDEDLARLREIVLFRELGFSLEAIAQVIDEPPAARLAALRAHRGRLVAEEQRTRSLIRAVDAAVEALQGGTTMTSKEMFEGFEEFASGEYAEEARERWGHTEAWAESQRRTRSYRKEDWAAIKVEAEVINTDFAALLDAGTAPDSVAAMDVAERARLHIDRWYYPLPHAGHVALADMYLADPRFTATYERIRPGLAAFVAAAIKANATRAAG